MNELDTKFWIRISLLNLCVVAGLGVLMRYKIGFDFPYFDQKFIQHAHSHFAFSGWVSHTLFAFLVSFLLSILNHKAHIKKYRFTIIFNLCCAYGMLISFSIQGYGLVSIAFSTASILNSFLFTYYYLKDLRAVSDHHPSKNWFIAALIFNAISTAGTFALAYMMMSKHLPQHLYLGSVYFYLHFQYNGWFFFSCMGLFLAFLHRKLPELSIPKPIFPLLIWSCIPAFFLSTLWAKLATWLYVIVVAGALGQFIGWLIFLNFLYVNKGKLQAIFKPAVRILSVLLVLTISIKFLLQLGSTVPEISKFAFGFRSIVIAYLHLVLLGIISIFLITYAIAMNFIQLNHRNSFFGLAAFTSFVFLIEIILAIQGIASFTYTLIPYSNELLLICSFALFAGLILLYKSQHKLTKQ